MTVYYQAMTVALIPVHFIGVGEGVDDLSPFSARDFGRAIAGLDS